MTDKAQKITAIYEREIENMKWHIKTNGSLIRKEEVKLCQIRIQDRQEFIIYLRGL